MDIRRLRPEERPASRTALGVAILRALHQLDDASPRILDDPIIPLLLDEGVLEKARANSEWIRAPMTTALRSHVVLRSRYAEDCLHGAAESGVRQYVILGSGFDTFAYRQPDWAAALRVFEVDHPASQRAKIGRLCQAGIPIPCNLEFVSADFESHSLEEILRSSTVDFDAPAFFSCLGVLVYLSEESINAIFRLTASFPKRSELVLTFSQGNLSALAEGAAALGEPWRSYHDPDMLCRQLLEAGFSKVSVLSPEEATDLYYRDRRDALPPPRRASVARAVV